MSFFKSKLQHSAPPTPPVHTHTHTGERKQKKAVLATVATSARQKERGSLAVFPLGQSSAADVNCVTV